MLEGLTLRGLQGWLTGPGLRVLLVLAGGLILTRVIHLAIARLPQFLTAAEGSPAEQAEQKKRTETLTRLLRTTASIAVMSIAALMAVHELGVAIVPILTGAGIAGLAVGFGAQYLVRDLIAGFFLILENQVRLGDVAVINGKGGLVEAIGLRTIVLRDFDGRVHIFRTAPSPSFPTSPRITLTTSST